MQDLKMPPKKEPKKTKAQENAGKSPTQKKAEQQAKYERKSARRLLKKHRVKECRSHSVQESGEEGGGQVMCSTLPSAISWGTSSRGRVEPGRSSASHDE